MFKFAGYLTRKPFFWASTLRIGLFLASVVGFPFLLMALAAVSGCRGIGGACGALGLVASTAFKPLAFVLFVFSFIGISMRRARDAAVPGWVGLFVPLLFAADQTALIFTGAPWYFAFSSGVLHTSFPRFALLALACIGVLCALPSRDERPDSANPFGYVGLAAFGIGLFVAVFAALSVAAGFPGVAPIVRPISLLVWSAAKFVSYAMVGLVALLAWIAWHERGQATAQRSRSIPEPRAVPTVSTNILVAFALVLTVVAVRLAMPDEFSLPLVLLTTLTAVILPTFLLYFCFMLAMFLVIRRRTATAVAFLALALLPFAHWAYAHWVASEEHVREAVEIAAIPTTGAPHVPTTIVFESPQMTGIYAVWTVRGIERVISKGAYGSRLNPTLMQFDRPPARGPVPASQPVGSLPDEYLLLKVGRESGFAKPGQIYGTAGGPLELRFVGPQHDDLVAVWYRAFNPRPSIVPVLTTNGWYRGSNVATTDEVAANIGAFLTKALRFSG